MPFVKLDCGILNSTLWFDRECRGLFVTALLMAQPFEVEKPMQTFAIDAIEPLDFEVPPGWYGFVKSAGIGIITADGQLDRQAGLAALARLGEPDPESRGKDFGGRRLVRVDGGFIVLNWQRYRDRDQTAAQRQARFRERHGIVRSGGPAKKPPKGGSEAEAAMIARGAKVGVEPRRGETMAGFTMRVMEASGVGLATPAKGGAGASSPATPAKDLGHS